MVSRALKFLLLLVLGLLVILWTFPRYFRPDPPIRHWSSIAIQSELLLKWDDLPESVQSRRPLLDVNEEGHPFLLTGQVLVPLKHQGGGAARLLGIPGAGQVDHFAWARDGALLLISGKSLGTLTKRGFQEILRLPSPHMRVEPASPGSVYLYGGDDPSQRRGLFLYDGSGKLVRLARAASAIEAVSGDGRLTFFSAGRTIYALGLGREVRPVYEAANPVVSIAMAPPWGVFYASEREVGYVSRAGEGYALIGAEGAQVKVRGESLYLILPRVGVLKASPVSRFEKYAQKGPADAWSLTGVPLFLGIGVIAVLALWTAMSDGWVPALVALSGASLAFFCGWYSYGALFGHGAWSILPGSGFRFDVLAWLVGTVTGVVLFVAADRFGSRRRCSPMASLFDWLLDAADAVAKPWRKRSEPRHAEDRARAVAPVQRGCDICNGSVVDGDQNLVDPDEMHRLAAHGYGEYVGKLGKSPPDKARKKFIRRASEQKRPWTVCGSCYRAADKYRDNSRAASHSDPMNAIPSASREPTRLRRLIWAIWDAYGVINKQTNDAGGMARHLKNLMKKMPREHLPTFESIHDETAAIEAFLRAPEPEFDRNDLAMLAAMPDLRVRYEMQCERLSEGSGYEYTETVVDEKLFSCESLRNLAVAMAERSTPK
jgi:hypothetical protein